MGNKQTEFRKVKKDMVCYALLQVNEKGEYVIYGSDLVVELGVLNNSMYGAGAGIFLHKEPKAIAGVFTHKAFVPKGSVILKETESTIRVVSAHISTHCVAKYGMWVDER